MNHQRQIILRALKNLSIFVLSALLLSSCAGLSQKPITRPPVKEKQTFAVPGPKKEKDALSKAYTDFTMAMLAISDRRYEKARSYLTKAIERDPESIYLNRTMALVLKKLKD
ncbi:MAG: hypothetical protein JRI80_03430, partial [Deltaproteobacteria bacterium]|nr:hypothetical protein [Deltaproteobacteria bacterium]